MSNLVGWVGSILFACCAFPQAVQAYRQGHSEGLSWAFLLMWLFGEVLTIAYVLPKRDWPLLFNYAANLAFLLVILRYKVRPR
jgi:uncharacterized protein with PQ loop repeat